ncbi:MAG: PAS domain-containing protein [Desulfomonilaceae bacterium]|nr:PAS domain-containing protein [Desulfomonilaceae bacterium]
MEMITSVIKRFFGSLSFKLSFFAGVITFIAVLSLTYHAISRQEQALIQEKVQGALKDSEVIEAAIWNGMMTKNREVIRQIVQAIGTKENFREIHIYDNKGILHYTSSVGDGLAIGTDSAAAQNPLLKNLADNTAFKYRFVEDGKYLNVVNPLRNSASCSSTKCHSGPDRERSLGALELTVPLEGLRTKIRDLKLQTILFASALLVLISTISGLAIVFGVLPPIRRLQENARKMAWGQYTPQGVPAAGSDEIAELTRLFDEMSLQINERTRQLEQSRRQYRELFEQVPCYLTVVDENYHITASNAAFKAEFGDQVGRSCFKGFKGRDSRCANCLVEKTFADGLPHRSEETWSLGDRKAFVIVHSAPIRDNGGRVSEVMEMALDVTRVERLQTQLNRKEEQFRNLFENVPCYLTVVDPSFRIAFHNRLFAEEFGSSWGKHCFEIYKGKDRKCDKCPVAETFSDGKSHSTEDTWHHNGKEIHVLIQTSPITDESGAIVAVVEMCTNVTELKLLQSQLIILGETIAGMSHSIKNILAGLEGGMYLVDSGLAKGREDRVRTGWEILRKNVGRVSELVKDILYASKEREPEYRECDPARILLDVYDLYEDMARKEGIEFVKDIPLTLGMAVLDPNGIHTCISNLVSNAIAACAAVRAKRSRRIVLKGQAQSDKLVIELSDHGIGMPQDVVEKLFTKFYSTKGSKGTGLGLVVTRKIVEEHGGRIEVESEFGVGTVFTVVIPLRQPISITA